MWDMSADNIVVYWAQMLGSPVNAKGGLVHIWFCWEALHIRISSLCDVDWADDDNVGR